MIAHTRQRIYAILDVAAVGDLTSRFVDMVITTLIILNVIAVILESVPSLTARWGPYFHAFDLFSVCVFTAEYALRMWACTADPRYAHPVGGRLRFAARPLVVIDLLAILPFFLHLAMPLDMRMLRVLRLIRLLRVFKLWRYSSALKVMSRVLLAKKEELVVCVIVMLLLLTFAAAIMHVVEHEEQPKAFGSIPAAMWWAVATLTTVGYGDVYPITVVGRVVGACMALIGIGMFAMPAGIIAQGFAEQWQGRRDDRSPIICPNCGEPVDDRHPGQPYESATQQPAA